MELLSKHLSLCSLIKPADWLNLRLFLGCAFAQFKTKEAAEKCMAAAEEDSEVTRNFTCLQFWITNDAYFMYLFVWSMSWCYCLLLTFGAEWWHPCRWQEAVCCGSSDQRRCCQAERGQDESRIGHQELVPSPRGMWVNPFHVLLITVLASDLCRFDLNHDITHGNCEPR